MAILFNTDKDKIKAFMDTLENHQNELVKTKSHSFGFDFKKERL